ncbi:MAG: hypothetical protein H6702_00240 [Myxococcales bacterium]|nr:hypothetical protein [Myxococcales bacterium]
MTPKEARRALKARRKALKHQLNQQLAQARRARAAQRRRASRQRRLVWRLILLALLLLLYLCLRGCDCECDPGGPFGPRRGVPAARDAGPDAAPALAPDMGPPPSRPRPRRRLKARTPAVERPAFHNARPPVEGWLAALRLQVAARGPRMSRCFEGSEAPGALRWTARVDVARGTVADHDFEPVLAGALITEPLRRCLVGVLSAPPFRLPPPDAPGPPAQVSILIEF